METILNLTAEYTDRIDRYIASNSTLSRAMIQNLIKNKAIFVNNINVRKANFQVKKNSHITITKVLSHKINAQPENINIEVVYEDDDIIVVNKKSGMVVHPAPGNLSGTLVNALLFRFQHLSDINGQIRPGIVHRIDKDTSGLIIIAKNNNAHIVLANDLKNHQIKRKYLCWVDGKIENSITHINLPIGRDLQNRKKMIVKKNNSKVAITHIFVKKIAGNKTLLKCELETGRTHQIRVHLAYIKHPVIGDPLYNKKIDEFGQQLHAYQLEFMHPITKKKMKLKAKPPQEFLK